jgi:hypothetical protein
VSDTGPVRASQVAPETEKSPDEIRAEKARAAVVARAVRIRALRKATEADGDPDAHARRVRTAENAAQERMRAYRERKGGHHG